MVMEEDRVGNAGRWILDEDWWLMDVKSWLYAGLGRQSRVNGGPVDLEESKAPNKQLAFRIMRKT